MPPKIPTEKLSHSICFGKKGDLDDKKRGTDRNLSLRETFLAQKSQSCGPGKIHSFVIFPQGSKEAPLKGEATAEDCRRRTSTPWMVAQTSRCNSRSTTESYLASGIETLDAWKTRRRSRWHVGPNSRTCILVLGISSCGYIDFIQLVNIYFISASIFQRPLPNSFTHRFLYGLSLASNLPCD